MLIFAFEIADRPAHVAGAQVHNLRGRGGKPADAEVGAEDHDRDRRRLDEVG